MIASVLAALLAARSPDAARVREVEVLLPLVGESKVYVPAGRPDRVILFLSGDGGWNRGVVDMARRAAAGGEALVAGLSYPRLRRAAAAASSSCWYPAGDLEIIGQALEKREKFGAYTRPALIGYSSGASLVYAALAAAPDSFSGGMSLGFCPDLEDVPPLCTHDRFHPEYDHAARKAAWEPVGEIGAPWVVLQGAQDKVCGASTTESFTNGVAGARLSLLPGVGHGYGNPLKWGEAFDRGLGEILHASVGAVGASDPKHAAGDPGLEKELEALDLPLELRLVEAPRGFFFFISGDGGWSNLDRAVVDGLAEKGISTVALNTLKYFWNEKPPERVAADLERLVKACHPGGLPLFAGGYSFGAEVMPVVLHRSEFAGRFAGLILIGPGPNASFEMSVLDWLRTKEKPTPNKVVDHARALGPLPLLCVSGEKEDESICPALSGGAGVELATLPGAHHFGGDYRKVGDACAGFLERLLRPAPAGAGAAITE